MNLISMILNLRVELIFILKVVHQDSFETEAKGNSEWYSFLGFRRIKAGKTLGYFYPWLVSKCLSRMYGFGWYNIGVNVHEFFYGSFLICVIVI